MAILFSVKLTFLNIHIRDALAEDSLALSLLVTELGYPTKSGQMKVRLKSIAGQPGYKTLIAETGGTIVGRVGACIGYYYEHDGTYLRVLAIITSAATRNKGIATAMLGAIEEWGKYQGA